MGPRLRINPLNGSASQRPALCPPLPLLCILSLWDLNTTHCFTAVPWAGDSRTLLQDPPSIPSSKPACPAAAWPFHWNSSQNSEPTNPRWESLFSHPHPRSTLVLGFPSQLRTGAASHTLMLKITKSCFLLTPSPSSHQSQSCKLLSFSFVWSLPHPHLLAHVASALNQTPNGSSTDHCSDLSHPSLS